MAKYVILSIDGGGIRGVAAAQFLHLVEAVMQRSCHEVCDLLAGTSTGAMIVLNMAANQATALECVELYNHENAQRIMDKSLFDKYLPVLSEPKYDGKGKRRVLREVFGEKRLRDVEKPVLVTSYDINKRSIAVFKNWGGMHSEHNPFVRDVADASSAAPTYFPTMKVEDDPNKWLIDGGMAANNPAMCGLSAALNMGKKLEDIYMLSVGAGKVLKDVERADEIGENSQGWGGIGWLQNGLIDHLFAGNVSATEYFCGQILGDRYVRVDSELVGANDALDDVSRSNIADLKQFGNRLFEVFGEAAIELLRR